MTACDVSFSNGEGNESRYLAVKIIICGRSLTTSDTEPMGRPLNCYSPLKFILYIQTLDINLYNKNYYWNCLRPSYTDCSTADIFSSVLGVLKLLGIRDTERKQDDTRAEALNYLYWNQHSIKRISKSSLNLPYCCETSTCLCTSRKLVFLAQFLKCQFT